MQTREDHLDRAVPLHESFQPRGLGESGAAAVQGVAPQEVVGFVQQDQQSASRLGVEPRVQSFAESLHAPRFTGGPLSGLVDRPQLLQVLPDHGPHIGRVGIADATVLEVDPDRELAALR